MADAAKRLLHSGEATSVPRQTTWAKAPFINNLCATPRAIAPPKSASTETYIGVRYNRMLVAPMHLSLSLDPHDTLVVHLKEGTEGTTVSVRPSGAGARSLLRALDHAVTEGYGECFWPGSPGGQYWWIFKRDDHAIEVCAMWTRGGASLWEHVFRATDAAAWVEEQLTSEIDRLGLRESS